LFTISSGRPDILLFKFIILPTRPWRLFLIDRSSSFSFSESLSILIPELNKEKNDVEINASSMTGHDAS